MTRDLILRMIIMKKIFIVAGIILLVCSACRDNSELTITDSFDVSKNASDIRIYSSDSLAQKEITSIKMDITMKPVKFKYIILYRELPAQLYFSSESYNYLLQQREIECYVNGVNILLNAKLKESKSLISIMLYRKIEKIVEKE